ncbi:helix-turn-helix domain-containing protein [uncultured Gemmiger sp.]|uniref:helix-turn-helix domain-containing protein n=1 Tax=uncultured Gemmiger sp. TaxID=1623490 RepID=UPI0025EF8AF2|nr:helix-turn-helix transcriptional regulator [uncultured Gemmiger sp.]
MLISETRKQKGMTQLELAEKMGVTDKAVSKWERDLSCPDVSSLPTLAQVLDLSLDELIQGKSEKSETGNKIASLVGTILKGVALAMGVAVAVLSVLNAITPQQALPMLGLGLACLAVHAMEDRS